MSSKKILNIQPIALTATLTTNIFNCNVTSLSGPVGFTMTQPFVLITRARVINKTSGAVTCSFWKGGTAGNVAGTEIWAQGLSVPANSYLDVYVGDGCRFDSADFLVGGAGAATSLTLELEAEIGISG